MRTLILVALALLGLAFPALARDVVPLGSSCLPKEESANLAIYVVKQELPRLGLPADTNLESIRAFVKMVKEAESTGNRFAVSSAGAMSFFQFKPQSARVAVNRLGNWQRRHELADEVPAWAEAIAEDPSQIYQICDSQQALLMMVNIVEQETSDEFLYQLIEGDTGAAKPLYYKFHHTKPDNPTVALIDRLFPQYFPEE